ncbi:LysM peptidoglycan-binding domain-containing protein [Streptomyces luteoverticillatus]|uniref:LysM peptidoglycan-binding domain-containing protein n=1 Tax=Streptomyces luteoverticillatus TaxID=66425 RepID=A0A3S9PD77_STRLT|nr:LysM peptidoglycan-binding domain-containing protein [Streptomyces luteoverticillatus]AZQ70272.1 LysM peptidoglycan-binding domain-containing protein [Streptomyces luteoverticillatus]
MIHRKRTAALVTGLAIPGALAGTAYATPQATATSTYSGAPDKAMPTTPALSSTADTSDKNTTSKKTMRTVREGDTLWDIAAQQLGSGEDWQRLYGANADKVTDPDLIFPGQTLTVDSTDPKTTPPPTEKAKAPMPSPASKKDRARASVSGTLDGWIEQAREELRKNGDLVPSAAAIKARAMIESGGNPRAINLTDSNAAAGTPSKGLLQVIDPTFRAYRLKSLPDDPYDPVASICAGVRYANATYGSFEKIAYQAGGY